jgi:hypothetical protein
MSIKHAPGSGSLGEVKGVIEWQGIMDVAGLRYNTQMRKIRGKNWQTDDAPREMRASVIYRERVGTNEDGTPRYKVSHKMKYHEQGDKARDSIIYAEWKPSNIKSGIIVKHARDAYNLITQLQLEKDRGSKQSHGSPLQPQLDAAKNRYRKMLKTETDASHPLMQHQLLWTDMFPEITEDNASRLPGASRCDMCSRLKSDCGKLFHQGLYNLCAECCRTSSQKSALQGALSLYSPQTIKNVKNTSKWAFLFGLGRQDK